MDDATRAQVTAAQPDRSTWLSANAGSGKTRVLTDRVARLLLGEVDPAHILCLTYTKAAASEMQNRLFSRLGEWAMLPDDQLRTALASLGVHTQTDHVPLARARRLFATAIETPGGLRIQTIHAFCAALLRRFPLEAGVTPQFTEMDERMAQRLRADVIEAIASGPKSPLLASVARLHTGEDFDRLLLEILSHRARFARDADLHALLGLPPGTSRESIASQVFLGDERALLQQLFPALRNGKPTDASTCEHLSDLPGLDYFSLKTLEGIFLFKSGKTPFKAKIDTLPTKDVREAIPQLMPDLNAWMERVEAARQPRLALEAIENTRAITSFARAFLTDYDAAKSARGLLDFDDLIHKTRALLSDPDVAAWVLFRLDGGIDHILVDEAQDTSPAQWAVIEALARELTSGQGVQTESPRTIFAVGDKKQSIYSFQGADPRAFDTMRDIFKGRLADAPEPLREHSLKHSFRSSPAILSVVDATFPESEEAGFTSDQSHVAFHSGLAGRVDLWPPVPIPEEPEKPDWHDPVDMRAPDNPAVVLAERIAGQIAELVRTGHPIPDTRSPSGWRPVRPGDVLILVRSRQRPIFLETIRACKAVGLPVAGADRLKLADELAVRDILALLSFLATPEDDLSLAAALRSPLFRWSEQALFTLAHNRGKAFLWQLLRDQADAHPETLAVLNDLRGQVDYLRPYDLIERILTRHDGRKRLLSRLGRESEDGIDALLAQALNFERSNIDSLTGFLVWMAQDDLQIKRQLDAASDQIRVMTVHGAKGLEAPIVILPDCAKPRHQDRDSLLKSGDSILWKPAGDERPDALLPALDARDAAAENERDRLLYVAMTRAEKWLIVAAAGETGEGRDSWHAQIAGGLDACGAQAMDQPTGRGLRLETGAWISKAEANLPETAQDLSLDPVFATPATAPDPVTATLSPSDLPGAKALPGEAGQDTETALRDGRVIHRLLELLPGTDPLTWPRVADRIAHAEGADSGPTLAEVTRLLSASHLAHLFSENALTEVPVTAPLAALDGARMHGIIDRLIVAPDHVLIVDYKTNRMVPATPAACPEGILRQMGAYRAALQGLYPTRRIDTAILWTATGDLMMLPHDLVTDALSTTYMS